MKCGCPLLIFLHKIAITKAKFTSLIWMSIFLTDSGLIYFVPKCLSIIPIAIRSTSRWLCNSWIISEETREALIALTFASRFDLVTPMTGINFMPTCWNETLPFVMPRCFKMASMSSTHNNLEDFRWSNRNAAIVSKSEWLQINPQQDDTQLMGEGTTTQHCHACSLQSDKHEHVEAATDAQAQWYYTLGNRNKSEHSRTVLNICLHWN